MAFPVIEIAHCAANDAFKANPADIATTAKQTGDFLKATAGITKIVRGGLQHEDQSTGYLFIGWNTYEDHKALMASPEYPTLGAAVGDIWDAAQGIKMYHVRPEHDPAPVFEAPVTEVAKFTIKSAADRAGFEAAFATLTGAVTGAPKETGLLALTWGTGVEDEDVRVLMIGWTSVQDGLRKAERSSTLRGCEAWNLGQRNSLEQDQQAGPRNVFVTIWTRERWYFKRKYVKPPGTSDATSPGQVSRLSVGSTVDLVETDVFSFFAALLFVPETKALSLEGLDQVFSVLTHAYAAYY
ncbi:uncharacterized protein BXZ73DRAFT_79317 [Epithele typhae]|uniref:uncharacterized protein n=1 Tax=Epithele typhae TaxID=378194 RepID=UPI0020080436|nr:uncharacterized protein BXZ73DRAFT_79317 [Epithele typhae]KAH9923911.1 hypothetical protein BXZ73DRAFT_79317 [Epithele typhae]